MLMLVTPLTPCAGLLGVSSSIWTEGRADLRFSMEDEGIGGYGYGEESFRVLRFGQMKCLGVGVLVVGKLALSADSPLAPTPAAMSSSSEGIWLLASARRPNNPTCSAPSVFPAERTSRPCILEKHHCHTGTSSPSPSHPRSPGA